MSINLRHLELFHAVALEGNVSRAAAKLMVSQPAVSKQLRLLERSLGVTLVDRLPKGVRLTQAGEIVAACSRRIFDGVDEIERAVVELRGLKRGRLRIGASTTIGVYLLPELFVRFQQKFPELLLSLEIGPSAAIARRIAEDEIDLAFTEVLIERPDLSETVFAQDPLVAIVPSAHPMTGKRVSAQAFCRQPFVARDTGSDTRSFVEQRLADRGVLVNVVMTLGTTEAIKRAVAAGIGVGIVSRSAISMELQVGALAVVTLSDVSIERPLYRIGRRDETPSPAARAFIRESERLGVGLLRRGRLGGQGAGGK